MHKSLLRALLLLTVIGLGAAGCETPTDMAVGSGTDSYGAIANSNLSTYYYPHRAGVTYVYSNTIRTESGTTISTITGSNDTVVTLGFQGFNSSNDSIFAVRVTYKVASALSGRAVSALRYLPATSSFGGAYIDGTTALTGETTTFSLATRASSTDSTTTPTYGRLRSLASDLLGSGSSVWQTDTVYFSSNASHVALYEKNSSGSFVKSKDLFRSDVAITAGNEWSYSVWQQNTKLHVLADDKPITVGTSIYSTIHAKFENTNLNAGSTSEKFFASGRGPIRQVDTWYTTTDGVSRTKTSLIRDGVVILDLDEILSM